MVQPLQVLGLQQPKSRLHGTQDGPSVSTPGLVFLGAKTFVGLPRSRAACPSGYPPLPHPPTCWSTMNDSRSASSCGSHSPAPTSARPSSTRGGGMPGHDSRASRAQAEWYKI